MRGSVELLNPRACMRIRATARLRSWPATSGPYTPADRMRWTPRVRSSARAASERRLNRCGRTWSWLWAGAGARLEHVIKWTVHIVEGQSLQAGFEPFQRAWGDRSAPPLATVVFVAGLAYPGFLVELEAIAVVAGE